MIQIKRVYESPAAGDGARFLVERLWPRGGAQGYAQGALSTQSDGGVRLHAGSRLSQHAIDTSIDCRRCGVMHATT